MAKSWAKWFERRAEARRFEARGIEPYIDPVLLALRSDVDRYMRKRAVERASQVAVDVVRSIVPHIVDARVRHPRL